jgi:hypothetical protein
MTSKERQDLRTKLYSLGAHKCGGRWYCLGLYLGQTLMEAQRAVAILGEAHFAERRSRMAHFAKLRSRMARAAAAIVLWFACACQGQTNAPVYSANIFVALNTGSASRVVIDCQPLATGSLFNGVFTLPAGAEVEVRCAVNDLFRRVQTTGSTGKVSTRYYAVSGTNSVRLTWEE